MAIDDFDSPSRAAMTPKRSTNAMLAARLSPCACWLEVALAAHQDGAPSTTGRVLDLSRHGGTDGESELHWLREVAQIWSTPLVEQCVSAMSARRRQSEPA
jgi:hypothetical protein